MKYFSEEVIMAYFEVKVDNVPLVPEINTFIAEDQMQLETILSEIEITVNQETVSLQVVHIFLRNTIHSKPDELHCKLPNHVSQPCDFL